MNIIYRIISFLISTIFTIFTAVGTFPIAIPSNVSLDKMDTNNIIYSNDNFDFSYDKGKFSLSLNGVTMFADAVSQYKIENTLYSSDDYEVFSLNQEEITDERGSGHRITATAIKSGLYEMNQIFNFYQDEKYFTVSLSLSSDGDIVASNYIAPIVILGGKIPLIHGNGQLAQGVKQCLLHSVLERTGVGGRQVIALCVCPLVHIEGVNVVALNLPLL